MKSSKPSRFLDNGDSFWSFLDHVLVVCPRCDKKAHIKCQTDDVTGYHAFRLTCSHCGCNRRNLPSYHWDIIQPKAGCFMKHALWLKAFVRGHCLWALNERHLNYLERYIVATLRERVMALPAVSVWDPHFGKRENPLDQETTRRFIVDGNGLVRNGFHVVSRLPNWMVLKGNREHVLRGFEKLKKLLTASES